MLTRIDLRHFKCFSLLKLPLSALTLLSGGNASGKSSVLQALVLLHQTMREQEWSTRLMLNGEAVRLGSAGDVIDQVHGRGGCEIGLLDGEKEYCWEFEGEHDELSLAVSRVSVNHRERKKPKLLRYLLPLERQASLSRRLRKLAYLTAERLGPRESYILEDPQRTPVVGPRGEHAASVLYSGRDDRVLEGLEIEDAPRRRLRQVEARMTRFFPGCELELEQIPRVNAVTLGLRTSGDTDFQRPIHTGFGLTQVLPIVTAALSAQRNGLLLIENPEVHLYPAGQAAMGEFLAETAAAGVQVLVETHSDHVLNGIRRAVKEGLLPAEDTALHFFRPRRGDGQGGEAQVQSPTLHPDGGIDDWPDGFFDQFDKDMNYFAGWS